MTDRKEVIERVVKELNDVLDKMEDEDEDENKKYSRALKAKRAIETGIELGVDQWCLLRQRNESADSWCFSFYAMGHLIGSVVKIFNKLFTKQLKEDRITLS